MTDLDEALIAFYGARLDEDEATARAQAALDEAQGSTASAGTSFGARFSPARVLREVEAGRKLIAAYQAAADAFEEQVDEHERNAPMPTFIETERGPAVAPAAYADLMETAAPAGQLWVALRLQVEARAGVWSGHPDYRQEWDPDYDYDGDST